MTQMTYTEIGKPVIDPAMLDLFVYNEQGLWLDPSDLSTLFQDTAGTTPVTAPGQTVALALDKRLGLRRGPELVSNGDFSNGPAGYVEALNGTISYANATMLATGTTGNTGVYRDVAVVAGRPYQVSWRQVSGSNNRINIYNGASFASSLYNNGVGDTITGTRSVIVLPTATVLRIYIHTAPGFTAEFDNVSVRDLEGNHLIQPVALSRPTLGRHPVGGRRNLLTYTEDLLSSRWSKLQVSVVLSGMPLPSGVAAAFKLTETTSDSTHSTFQQFSFVAGVEYTIWTRAKFDGRHLQLIPPTAALAGGYANFDLQTGVKGPFGGSGLTSEMIPESDGWHLCSITFTATGSTTGSPTFLLVPSPESTRLQPYTGDGVSGVYLGGPQIEVGDRTPYQRVTSDWDVTEAGKRDCWYLGFDGVDDFMSSIANLDLTASDKLTIWAGLEKLSDTPTGIFFETSPSVLSASYPGSAGWVIPSVSGATSAGFNVRGSAAICGRTGSWSPAPARAVLSSAYDIAGAIQADEVFPRINGVIPTLVSVGLPSGTGDFGNYKSYLGRRGEGGLSFNGRMYGLIVRGKSATSAQINFVEQILAYNTGITI
jgi:hypothetical protein